MLQLTLPLAFALLALLVLMPSDDAKMLTVALASALVFVGFIIAGSVTSAATPENPRPNRVQYGLNADTDEAILSTRNEVLDEWMVQFLGDAE